MRPHKEPYLTEHNKIRPQAKRSNTHSLELFRSGSIAEYGNPTACPTHRVAISEDLASQTHSSPLTRVRVSANSNVNVIFSLKIKCRQHSSGTPAHNGSDDDGDFTFLFPPRFWKRGRRTHPMHAIHPVRLAWWYCAFGCPSLYMLRETRKASSSTIVCWRATRK